MPQKMAGAAAVPGWPGACDGVDHMKRVKSHELGEVDLKQHGGGGGFGGQAGVESVEKDQGLGHDDEEGESGAQQEETNTDRQRGEHHLFLRGAQSRQDELQEEIEQQGAGDDDAAHEGHVHDRHEAADGLQLLEDDLFPDAGDHERISDECPELGIEHKGSDHEDRQCRRDAHQHGAEVVEVVEKRFFHIVLAEIHGDLFADLDDFTEEPFEHGAGILC